MSVAKSTKQRWLQELIYCCLWPIVASLAPAPPLATYEFGFSLNPTSNDELYTLWIYKVYEDRVIDSHPVTLETFMVDARWKTTGACRSLLPFARPVAKFALWPGSRSDPWNRLGTRTLRTLTETADHFAGLSIAVP